MRTVQGVTLQGVTLQGVTLQGVTQHGCHTIWLSHNMAVTETRGVTQVKRLVRSVEHEGQ